MHKPRVDSILTHVLVVSWHALRVLGSTHALQTLPSYFRGSRVTRLTVVWLSGTIFLFFVRVHPYDPVRLALALTRLRDGLTLKSLRLFITTFVLCTAATPTTDYESLRSNGITVHSRRTTIDLLTVTKSPNYEVIRVAQQTVIPARSKSAVLVMSTVAGQWIMVWRGEEDKLSSIEKYPKLCN